MPLIEKNSANLAENSYDIVDSRGSRIEQSTPTEETLTRLRYGQLFLRQRPGEVNSLDLIKFELPNPCDVYLHGSPGHDLSHASASSKTSKAETPLSSKNSRVNGLWLPQVSRKV